MRDYKKEKTSFGFWQVTPLPTKEEVNEYFREKYYQDNISLQYTQKYSEDEIVFKHNKHYVAERIINKFRNKKMESLIDVGCGEGYLLDYFYRHNWKVTGTDASSYAIKQHNPHLISFFHEGDLYDVLKKISSENQYFDVIFLLEVLYHTIDPKYVIELLKKLMNKNSLLIISSANNYSPYQLKLLESGMIDKDYWFTPPDHLQYFTLPSLSNLLQDCGLKIKFSYADFPIELFLANNYSNYRIDTSKGKAAHNARVFIDNFLVEQGIDRYLNFMHSMAEIGLGRNFTVVAEL
jgi:2-polyprenyl-3-methyl-5-hydroxy-6-metoxy-1,4-benzoquinol methylase